MALPFETRVKTALEGKTFRTGQLRDLIAEGAEIVEAMRAQAAQAAAESVDFALSEEDRDDAADRAERARRNAAALASAVAALEAKLVERRASDKAQAAEAERVAAMAERDELVRRWADLPALLSDMTDLFANTQTNAERLAAAGLGREPDAEAVARGIPSSFYMPGGLTPVSRFVEMKVPNWCGAGRSWPPDRSIEIAQAASQQARDIKRKHKARMAEQEAQFGYYRLTPRGRTMISFRPRLAPDLHYEAKPRGLYREAWMGEIKHTEAARLRELGVNVEAVTREQAETAANESVD